MTRHTLTGTIWGIILALLIYFLSLAVGFTGEISIPVSVGAAIISGGFLGLIIGSNEMHPYPGAVAGAVTAGLFSVLIGSVFYSSVNLSITFLISGISAGAFTGAACALIVGRVNYSKR